MTDTLQLRRGTTAKTAAFTGLVGELTVDTDKKVAVVHDGSKTGGFALLRDDLSNIGPVKANVVPDLDNTYSLGSPTKRWKDIYVGNNTIHIGDSTSFSGTSLVIDAGSNPTSLSQMPTLLASKLVAKPFQYNPGSGSITVRPSIEFQDTTGASYPISFNTVTKEFSLDADGNHGEGSLVAKKVTLTGDLMGGTAGSFRWDGNTTLGYDQSSTVTVKGTATFQNGVNLNGAVTVGDGNDTITINAGASNALNITSSTLSVNGTGVTVSGGLVVSGNLTVNGTTSTIHSTNITVGDNILILNADIPSGQDPSLDAGIQVARGTAASVKWIWDEANDYWSPAGANLGNIGTLTAGTINVTNLNATGLNATSAAKLTTARNITLAGSVTGTASFDGSSDVIITTTGGAVNNVAGTMMVLVSEQVVSSPTTSVTFTGLSGDDDVEYEIRGTIVGGAAVSTFYQFRPNGDATLANYKSYILYNNAVNGNGTPAGNSETIAGFRIGLNSSVGMGSTFTLNFQAKSGTQRNYTATYVQGASGSSVSATVLGTGTWNNTASNVTSITIASDNGSGSTVANGIGAGTRIALYARKKVGGTASTVNASMAGALVKRTDNVQTAANNTWTMIQWQAADYDTSGFWSSGQPTRITIPAGVNKIRISAFGTSSVALAFPYIAVYKNGTSYMFFDRQGTTNSAMYGNFTTPAFAVQAGDYIEIAVYQSNGSAAVIGTGSYVGVEVVDPVPVAISGFGSNTTADYALVTNSSQATPVNLPAVNGNIPFDISTGTLSLLNNGILLKAGKTYELDASLYVTFSSPAGWVDYQFHDGTNWLGIAGEALPVTYTANYAPSAGARAIFTPMVDTYVYLRVKTLQNATTFSPGASYIVVKQVGGPANGLNYGPAGYASLSFTGDPVTLTTTTDAIIPFPNLTGNLTAANSGVTLKAGRTYLLQASLHMSNSTTGGYLSYRFHDGTAYIGNQAQSLALNYVGSVGSNTVATAVYRPNVDTTVTLRVVNANGTVSAYGSNSFFNVMELASAVDTYSTNETLTGKIWIDGKPIYRKVVSCGTLPNATTKTVAHGITGMTFVTHYEGIATDGSSRITMPYAANAGTNSLAMAVDGTNISLLSQYNWSTYTTSYVTIEYTK